MIARVTYFVVSAALLLGFLVIVVTGGQLMATGNAMAIGIGLSAEVLVALGCWFLWKTYRFGRRSGQLARQLEAEGGLPVDELQRRRPDRPGLRRRGLRPAPGRDRVRPGRLADLVPPRGRLRGRTGHPARPQGDAAGDQPSRRDGVVGPPYSSSGSAFPPITISVLSPVGRSPCRS